MDIRRAEYIVISTDDQPGQLARFSKKISEYEINLEAIWSFGTGRGNAEIIAIPWDSNLY